MNIGARVRIKRTGEVGVITGISGNDIWVSIDKGESIRFKKKAVTLLPRNY